MAKYDQFIFKYKSMDPKPSVIEAISEILLEQSRLQDSGIIRKKS